MRKPWDDYFMDLSFVVAERSTCLRRNIGAVAVKDKRIIATGYNGPPPGISHCIDDGGCQRERLNIPSGQQHEKCKAIHAEENIIVQCAIHGINISGATLYITAKPCSLCARKLISLKLNEIIFPANSYPDDETEKLFKEVGGLKYKKVPLGDKLIVTEFWKFNLKKYTGMPEAKYD
jgi:dCMP deaminase